MKRIFTGILILLAIMLFFASKGIFQQSKELPPSQLLVPVEEFVPSLKRTYPLQDKDALFSKNGRWTATWYLASNNEQPSHPNAALRIEHYNSSLRSFISFWTVHYWRMLSSKGIYFRPTQCPSQLASDCVMACSIPNTGSFCRSIARYGQYIILFQMDVQQSSPKNKNFITVWEKVDNYFSNLLAPESNSSKGPIQNPTKERQKMACQRPA